MQNSIKGELRGILIFVAVLWAVLGLDAILSYDLTKWGLVPRTLWGLIGIVTSPFLHAGVLHLLSNTVPLVVLLTLFAGSRSRTWEAILEIAMTGGALLWMLGRNGDSNQPVIHVGASGLVYGLIAFLIVAGFLERRPISLGVAILVGFLYGGTLLYGVLPTQPGVSWDGHLFGALGGAAVAYFNLGKPQMDSVKSNPPT
ncbi:MAG: rhomboid family intramembrane serine protease [Planctomycetota bacterium]|nr:rhomboid family intramembrane serine protease [Planctomycetota bacterium]